MTLQELLGEAYKEGMTLEDVESALGEFSLPEDKTEEIERLRTALSKSNSEAAGYKKQLREKLSEDEQQKQQQLEERTELQEKYEKLLAEVETSKNKAKFLALGYDEKLAEETAAAMVNNDLETVFKNQKKHQQSLEQKVRADVLKETPPPVSGDGGQTMTLESFRQLSPEKRYEFSVNNPDEYKALYEGGNE